MKILRFTSREKALKASSKFLIKGRRLRIVKSGDAWELRVTARGQR